MELITYTPEYSIGNEKQDRENENRVFKQQLHNVESAIELLQAKVELANFDKNLKVYSNPVRICKHCGEPLQILTTSVVSNEPKWLHTNMYVEAEPTMCKNCLLTIGNKN